MLFQIQTIRFEVHHFDSREKKPAICCSLLQLTLGEVSSWMLKPEGLSYFKLWCFDYLCQKVPSQPVMSCVKSGFFLCRAWEFPGFAFDPWFIFCAGKGSSNVCWEGTSGALLLTREKREWCQRACCRQHFQSNHSLPCPGCNIWKGSPWIRSHLGAPWLVKHLLVRSLQSDFDWRWKSHLNPRH